MQSFSDVLTGKTRQLPAIVLAGAVALSAAACQSASPTSPSAGVGDLSISDAGTSSLNAELGYCVEEINRHRTSVGLNGLRRSSTLETYAATVAQHDATVREAHSHFRNTNGGGVAQAETQILWWRGYAISQVIKKGLSQMWDVGPSGTHYQVLAGPYSEVGCGIYVANGEVTVAQDFR